MKNLLITLLSLFISTATAPEYSSIYGEFKDVDTEELTSQIIFLHNNSGSQYYTEVDQKGEFCIRKMRCGEYSVFITLNGLKYNPFTLKLQPKDNFIAFMEDKKKKEISTYLVFE